MWYLYRQEGIIGSKRFLKIRWEGYSYYKQTSEDYSLKWELFLFDDGKMFLNVINVPTSGSIGTNSLICGGNTYPFTLTAGTPVSYIFTPNDITGSEWNVAEGAIESEPVKSNGNAIFEVCGIVAESVKGVTLSWMEDIPNDTTVAAYVSSDGTVWHKIENGVMLKGNFINDDGSLFIKMELATADVYETPIISDMKPIVHMEGIAISYEQPKGNLMGAGGLVADFKMSFLPTDLIAKPHQNDEEHIEISDITAIGNLIHIYYTDAAETEHIEISSIEAVGVLTHINDL